MIKTDVNYASACDDVTRCINEKNKSEINGNCGDVYIGTNEAGRQETFECLATGAAGTQSCHVGFSSWFNFDIIVKRQSGRAVLIDFNPNTKSFLVETLNCVIASNDRSEFANKIRQYIENNTGKFCINCSEGEEREYYEDVLFPQDEVFCELNIPGNWLNSDEGFNYIKKLASEGKIAVITEDIRSHENFKRISSVINENGYVVDTLYVSNISKYMDSDEDKEYFVKSVNCFSFPETKIIHCLPWSLEQKVIEVGRISKVDSEGRKVSRTMLFSYW